jgi:hypothetical protein
MAGDAVMIAPVSSQTPCKQGIFQGIREIRAPGDTNVCEKRCNYSAFALIPVHN